MVFHVTGATHVIRLGRATLKLIQDRGIGFAHQIRQHVQATTMRHPDNDFFDAELCAPLENLLKRRDQRLTAIQTKPLGARELLVEILLEAFGLDQTVIDRFLAAIREMRLIAD